MSLDGRLNPYRTPTPYDVLGVKEGPRASANDIGKAYNDQKKNTRKIKDTKERARRLEELDQAKEQLLRPEDRVQIDFFILGNRIFGDLSERFGGSLTSGNLATEKVIGPLHCARRYDQFTPEDLRQFEGAFNLLDPPAFHDDPSRSAKLPLAQLD